MMLLSDWVFTQQPYVIQRLLRHLIRQPGFKILLSNTTQDRVSTALVPPERCGREDLLNSIRAWFEMGVPQSGKTHLPVR